MRLAERAGVSLIVPDDIDSLCCGTPWTSKGMRSGHAALEARVQTSLLRATGGGKLPVVMDAASCTHGIMDIAEKIGIEVIDAVTFVAEQMLDTLPAGKKVESITLHPTCSTTHLGIQADLEKVAAATADEVRVPASWGCCGYAGDRGMLHPELTDEAAKQEASEVELLESAVHASCNRTCELGMTRATGEDYHHVLEVLEQVTR